MEKKRAWLEAQGWRVGSAEEFLGLNPEETAYVELRLKLGDTVRELRKKRHLTQVQLAELLASSQSRVAKVEGICLPRSDRQWELSILYEGASTLQRIVVKAESELMSCC